MQFNPSDFLVRASPRHDHDKKSSSRNHYKSAASVNINVHMPAATTAWDVSRNDQKSRFQRIVKSLSVATAAAPSPSHGNARPAAIVLVDSSSSSSLQQPSLTIQPPGNVVKSIGSAMYNYLFRGNHSTVAPPDDPTTTTGEAAKSLKDTAHDVPDEVHLSGLDDLRSPDVLNAIKGLLQTAVKQGMVDIVSYIAGPSSVVRGHSRRRPSQLDVIAIPSSAVVASAPSNKALADAVIARFSATPVKSPSDAVALALMCDNVVVVDDQDVEETKKQYSELLKAAASNGKKGDLAVGHVHCDLVRTAVMRARQKRVSGMLRNSGAFVNAQLYAFFPLCVMVQQKDPRKLRLKFVPQLASASAYDTPIVAIDINVADTTTTPKLFVPALYWSPQFGLHARVVAIVDPSKHLID